MNRLSIILLALIILAVTAGCGEKKETPMVDMDTIKSDGSHDDKYIFKKEIEKQENRDKKYKKNNF